jgi:type II secretory pathway pseudopilin PulG
MKKGQSLIEVIVALAILTAGFLGILTLLAQSIHISKTISNETTATYLAAEGLELSKNLIDHDVYENIAGFGFGWGACFLPLSAGQSHDYEFDYTQITCPPPDYSGSDVLYYSPATHLYSYTNSGGSIATFFTRRIRVTMDPSIPEITVQSIVSWPTGLTNQSVTLTDNFYNWHP